MGRCSPGFGDISSCLNLPALALPREAAGAGLSVGWATDRANRRESHPWPIVSFSIGTADVLFLDTKGPTKRWDAHGLPMAAVVAPHDAHLRRQTIELTGAASPYCRRRRRDCPAAAGRDAGPAALPQGAGQD